MLEPVAQQSAMLSALLWFLLLPLHILTEEFDEEVDGRIPFTEIYLYDDNQYILFSSSVTWQEANYICLSYKARLAEVTDNEEAAFLEAAMTDSSIVLKDMWIGGQHEDSRWQWAGSRQDIPSQPTNGFPPWKEAPNRPERECLAMRHLEYDTPLFVDLSCFSLRPFMCERNADAVSSPVPFKWEKIGHETFVLYHGRLTWAEAVAFCHQRGMRLAIAESAEVIRIISEAMHHTRPDLENVWIGAYGKGGRWWWLSTGEQLSSRADASGFPPWQRDVTTRDHGCVLLDRHVCKHPVFVEARCSRARNFVCQLSQAESVDPCVKPMKSAVFHHGGQRLVLHPEQRTWDSANKTCVLEGGHLVSLRSPELISSIVLAMGDFREEISHVWVGGIVENASWTRVADGTVSPTEPDVNGFPPWSGHGHVQDVVCLNLDQKGHSSGLLYGLLCNKTQAFVCETGIQRAECL